MRPLSARNPRVQRLARLVRRGDERAEQRVLVVEGPVLLGAALDAGIAVLEVFIDEGVAERPMITELGLRLPAEVTRWVLPAGTLDRVGDAATSQGIIAVVERRDPSWPAPDTTAFVLVLAEVADPGNVGTLVRAAAASGAGTAVIAGGADPTNPKVVRASAGAIFAIDVVRSASAGDAVARLQAVGYRVAATTVSGGVAYHRADLGSPLAVVVGNEAHGLTDDLIARTDLALTVPMTGPVQSLNVAMAGTVICFEVLRQASAV
ncbi:RNA methyltransferase [soil metagenome]